VPKKSAEKSAEKIVPTNFASARLSARFSLIQRHRIFIFLTAVFAQLYLVGNAKRS
jgi:hypothetical protein